MAMLSLVLDLLFLIVVAVEYIGPAFLITLLVSAIAMLPGDSTTVAP